MWGTEKEVQAVAEDDGNCSALHHVLFYLSREAFSQTLCELLNAKITIS